ncbi:MAG: glycoside hydrolase family 3 N-terminal domain-containing protein [Eubacteriales bacterium]|nr:glycoside hydrolase family 3 N-terminal domain-containing protein [Eubacteriales bacterium]
MKKSSSKMISVLMGMSLLAAPLSGVATVAAAPSDAGKELSQQIAAEGIVLLKNEDKTLPLATDKTLSVFGTTQLDAYYGGGGSGSVTTSDLVDFLTAMKDEGFKLNEDLLKAYQTWWDEGGSEQDYRPVEGTGEALGEYTVSAVAHAEMPLTDELVADAKKVSDTAVVVLGRSGSEGLDLGKNDMALYPAEIEMLDKVTAQFDNVVVLLNICNAVSLSELDNYEQIKSVAIIWAPGEFGMTSVAGVLSGAVTPSGKLADTFTYSVDDHPSTVNFGDFVKPLNPDNLAACELKEVQETNRDGVEETVLKWEHADDCTYETCPGDHYFVEYEEDIWVGYRYFETPEFQKENAVQYEFGYGLSYTDFSIETLNFQADDNAVTAEVKVTNTGDEYSGKEVVQLYFGAPDGELEKPAKELGAFAKTKELAPGESQTMTLSMDTDEMSSYSEALEAYVMEDGDYKIYLGNSVRNVEEIGTYTLAEDKVIKNDAVTGTEIKNLFPDLQGDDMTLMTKADSAGTYPTAPTVGEKTEPSNGWSSTGASTRGTGNTGGRFVESGLPELDENNTLPMAEGEVKAEIQLLDVYNDPSLMEAFVDQFTDEELVMMQLYGGFKTIGIERLGIPATVSQDGPASVKSSDRDNSGTAFPVSTMQACTWNTDLHYERGVVSAQEAKELGTNSWYAPAANTHRNPMGGRNFEYYSEDPLLGGAAMAYTARGAQENGLTCMLKHFAGNDQETNRNGIETYMSERAYREIYLKPFEYGVKAGAKGIMSAFNRLNTTWCGASAPLLTDLLRKEWGFEGFVVTDMWCNGYMVAPEAAMAGNDTMLLGHGTGMNSAEDYSAAFESDPEGIRTALKEAAKNICDYAMTTYAFSDVCGSTDNIGLDKPAVYPFSVN